MPVPAPLTVTQLGAPLTVQAGQALPPVMLTVPLPPAAVKPCPPALRARRRPVLDVRHSYTADPQERLLPGILSELAGIPELLIVLNHPFWLEEGVQEPDHRRALDFTPSS